MKVKKVLNQRLNCPGVLERHHRKWLMLFQICRGNSLTSPPPSSGTSHQLEKLSAADCCSPTETIQNQTNANKYKCCTYQLLCQNVNRVKENSGTVRMQTRVINKKNHSELSAGVCSITIAHTHAKEIHFGKLCPINCCNHYSAYVANLSLAISITVGRWSTERDRTKLWWSHDKTQQDHLSHKHTG